MTAYEAGALGLIAVGLEFIGGDDDECDRHCVVQLNGSCWFNSTLNSLILVPELRTRIVSAWLERTEDPEKYDADPTALHDYCPNFDRSGSYDIEGMRDVFARFIYNILHKNKKFEPRYADDLADKVKSSHDYYAAFLGRDRLWASRHLMGQGGSPSVSMKVLARVFFDEGSYSILSRPVDDQPPMKVEDVDAHVRSLKAPPEILILSGQISLDVMRKRFAVDGTFYDLKSAVNVFHISSLNETHGISCVICNGRQLIYDSNSTDMIATNWVDGDFSGYDYIQSLKQHMGPGDWGYFETCIYVARG